MSKSGSQGVGILFMVVAGILTGGAYSLWQHEPRTRAYVGASIIVGVIAAALLFSGYTRLG
jgi:hypothetical protein